MDNSQLFALMLSETKKQEPALILKCNEASSQFGLTLSEKQVSALIEQRNISLTRHRRVEMGPGVSDKIIFAFCDSDFINQDDYLPTLMKLTDLFYEFKTRTEDKVTDDELIALMRDQFENVCFGDLRLLERVALPKFADAVKKGYTGYQKKDGVEQYRANGEEAEWVRDLYERVLENMDY